MREEKKERGGGGEPRAIESKYLNIRRHLTSLKCFKIQRLYLSLVWQGTTPADKPL